MDPSPRTSLPSGARYEAPGNVRRTTILYEDGTEIVITADGDGERLFSNRPMEQRPDGIWRVRR